MVCFDQSWWPNWHKDSSLSELSASYTHTNIELKQQQQSVRSDARASDLSFLFFSVRALFSSIKGWRLSASRLLISYDAAVAAAADDDVAAGGGDDDDACNDDDIVLSVACFAGGVSLISRLIRCVSW